jgi:hypothetical protein
LHDVKVNGITIGASDLDYWFCDDPQNDMASEHRLYETDWSEVVQTCCSKWRSVLMRNVSRYHCCESNQMKQFVSMNGPNCCG